jgi:hypothetical protein
MPRKYYEKYTRELLTEAAANSISIAGVLRYLQIPRSGGTHAHISRRLKQFGIDTSHFKRVAPNRGKPCAWRLTRSTSWLCAHQAQRGRSRTSYAGHCAKVACRAPARRVASRPSGTASR